MKQKTDKVARLLSFVFCKKLLFSISNGHLIFIICIDDLLAMISCVCKSKVLQKIEYSRDGRFWLGRGFL